jgi:BioD-like phosphotransacetylase family protein
MKRVIDANAVRVLAHAQGHVWVDEDVAQRIAAAATTAVQAVAASVPTAETGLFPDAAIEFAATLDALAEPPA